LFPYVNALVLYVHAGFNSWISLLIISFHGTCRFTSSMFIRWLIERSSEPELVVEKFQEPLGLLVGSDRGPLRVAEGYHHQNLP
jgi:hypothetical protein